MFRDARLKAILKTLRGTGIDCQFKSRRLSRTANVSTGFGGEPIICISVPENSRIASITAHAEYALRAAGYSVTPSLYREIGRSDIIVHEPKHA